MSTPEIEPTGNDKRTRRAGRTLVASGTTNIIFAVIIVVCLGIMGKQADAITALSGGVNILRAQVDECKSKPANTKGCTTPAAAEPSVIVKQVVGSPGIPGSNGLNGAPGPAGPVGPAGPRGPAGPAGPPGARGPAGLPGGSPACLLEPTRCVGSTGPQGPEGAAGRDGADGKNGADGRDGADGKDGAKGDKGDPGDPGCPPGNHQIATNVLTKDQPIDGIASIQCVPDVGP